MHKLSYSYYLLLIINPIICSLLELLFTFTEIRVLQFDSVHIARVKDRFGNMPLHFAVNNQHYKVVEAFADKDPESLVLLNDDGESPLSIAIDLKQRTLVTKIIDLNHPTLDYRGHNRQTLLRRAVIRHELGKRLMSTTFPLFYFSFVFRQNEGLHLIYDSCSNNLIIR